MERILPERGAPAWFAPEVDSTNTRVKEWAGLGAEHGTVLLAGRQTGGRGRLGRCFESPPEGLYLSLLLRPDCPPERCASLTPLAAVAVRRAVRRCTGTAVDIKWPNDLLLHGKKLCGILTELGGQPGEIWVVIGIGVNANTPTEAFSPELRGTAGSLLSETGRRVDVRNLAAALVQELDRLYDAWRLDSRACLDEYREACVSCGRPLRILQNGGERSGFGLGINEDFSLRVRLDDGSQEDIRFGEVSVR